MALGYFWSIYVAGNWDFSCLLSFLSKIQGVIVSLAGSFKVPQAGLLFL